MSSFIKHLAALQPIGAIRKKRRWKSIGKSKKNIAHCLAAYQCLRDLQIYCAASADQCSGITGECKTVVRIAGILYLFHAMGKQPQNALTFVSRTGFH